MLGLAGPQNAPEGGPECITRAGRMPATGEGGVVVPRPGSWGTPPPGIGGARTAEVRSCPHAVSQGIHLGGNTAR